MYQRPFDKGTIGHHGVELGIGNEVVVPAVNLTGSRRPRRMGDRVPQIGQKVNYRLAKGRFAGP